MLKLDNTLLDELGLGILPEEQKRAMLQHIYDTLELRVGTNLANQMSDRQLDEFEKFIDENGDANQAQALQWLEANLPHYKQVVNDVFEALKTEIKQMAPQILVSSGLQPATVTVADPQTVPNPAQQAQTQQIPPVSAPTAIPSSVTRGGQADQPNPAGGQWSQRSPQAAQNQDAQVYQFPAQQPPAGPGSWPADHAA